MHSYAGSSINSLKTPYWVSLENDTILGHFGVNRVPCLLDDKCLLTTSSIPAHLFPRVSGSVYITWHIHSVITFYSIALNYLWPKMCKTTWKDTWPRVVIKMKIGVKLTSNLYLMNVFSRTECGGSETEICPLLLTEIIYWNRKINPIATGNSQVLMTSLIVHFFKTSVASELINQSWKSVSFILIVDGHE